MSTTKSHASIISAFWAGHNITKSSKCIYLRTINIWFLRCHRFHSGFFFLFTLIIFVKRNSFFSQSIPPTTYNLRKSVRWCLTIGIFLWLNLFGLNSILLFFNRKFLFVTDSAIPKSNHSWTWFVIIKHWNEMFCCWISSFVWRFIKS